MNKKAFTLIELLVVVLIIGILAAIALPQYQKAVTRARVTEAIINLRAIHTALEEYKLANGSYPTTTSHTDQDELTANLSIDIPRLNKMFTFSYYRSSYVGYFFNYKGVNIYIEMNWSSAQYKPGTLMCLMVAAQKTADSLAFCSSICGTSQMEELSDAIGCRI
ncbi:MAG: prepilin-type N-terminal cleavage/methylation domain-containing protein [Elusimicrobiaceae bacterium]|nr:prepilin-type N-terminal cleavage/methylation domain-containing protein [Elusimicrobiaceae bacterium]